MVEKQTIQKDVAESYQNQVENYLKSMLHTRTWKVGDHITSERELALTLQISRTTVRNAILNLTNQGFFERKVGQGTFVKRTICTEQQPPVQKKTTNTIGYVICKEHEVQKPLANEDFYFDIFSGIEEIIAKSRKHLLFSYLDEYDIPDRGRFDLFLEKVDGVILEEASNADLIKHIQEIGKPLVLLAPTIAPKGTNLVTTDIQGGVKKAINYLASLSHTRIAIINGPLHLETARMRDQAWAESLMRLFGDVPSDLRAGGDSWTSEQGYIAMKSLLQLQAPPTAVFCANDLIAMGALKATAELGIAVPKDISLMGFDDSRFAEVLVPPLTTMKIYSRSMGNFAARRILESLEEGDSPSVTIEVPIDLLVRNSCKEVKE